MGLYEDTEVEKFDEMQVVEEVKENEELQPLSMDDLDDDHSCSTCDVFDDYTKCAIYNAVNKLYKKRLKIDDEFSCNMHSELKD